MRSVVVVLPASMWAMIPMFRTRSRPTRLSVTDIALTTDSARRPCWPAPSGRGRPCACRRRPAGLLADLVERGVDDVLGDRLLPAGHHAVDQLLDQDRVVHGIRLDRPDLDLCAARH